MGFFLHVGTRSDTAGSVGGGPLDLVLHDLGGGAARLYATDGTGGVLVRDPARALAATDDTPRSGAGRAGVPGVELLSLGGQTVLASFGQGTGLTTRAIASDGSLAAPVALAVGAATVVAVAATALAGGRDLVVTSALQGHGVTTWLRSADGRLTQVERLSLGSDNRGYDAQDIAVVTRGGASFLVALSADADQVSVFRLDTAAGAGQGRATLVETLGPADGLPISTPVRIETLRMEGRDIVLIGSAGTGSVTVAELTDAGRLRVLDQVNDDLNTRFGGLGVLDSVTVNGRVYVVAGGADDGLTLMTLLPNGRLLHLDTIADTTAMALSDVAGLALRVVTGPAGPQIEVYAAGEGEGAITRLRIDLGALAPVQRADAGGARVEGDARGNLLLGGAGADTLWGREGADILIDGAGSDVMRGGPGRDVFVLSADRALDRIMDFEIGLDRLDLSALGRIYDRSQLRFATIPGGIQITVGTERTQLFSADGRAIPASALTNAQLFDLWHAGPLALPDDGRRIEGTGLADMLLGKAGDDDILGMGGRDRLIGGPGDDRLLGERMNDAFDPVAAQVYRLYRATLDRAPDPGGHAAWTNALMSGGRDLGQVIDGFVGSREFQARYGATDDRAFVTLLYNNVLDRAPDPGGFAAWTQALATGRLSRAEVVQGFSESREFQTKTEAAALGFSRAAVQADWTDDVYRLYRATLDREPDPGGHAAWTNALADGRGFLEVAGGFVNSREFQARYGATDDRAFVTLLYNNVLDRAPDPGGFATWTQALATGRLSRVEVVQGFAQSTEFRRDTAPDVKAWMRAQGADDHLTGGAGRNVLVGGLGADCFVFDRATGGTHHVADLEPWDWLELTGFGYADTRSALSRFAQVGDDVVFAHQGVTVIFSDLKLAQITPDMLLI